jgi:putative DNA primase/helicase
MTAQVIALNIASSFLRRTAQGTIKDDIANAMDAIKRLSFINVYFNEFSGIMEVDSELPWRGAGRRPWIDHDTIKLTEFFQNQDIPFKKTNVVDAVEAVAFDRRRHPLREWLSSIKWDGQARLDTWLTYCLGAPDNTYTRAVAAAWCISAVARVFEPGCKADYVLVLEGYQGIKKSTALKTLCGAEYFTDEVPALGSKDCAIQLRGSWIIEMPELDSISRAQVSAVKAFLTSTVDKYRPPYGRLPIEVPRQCVFAGTVNDLEWLADVDNRRFWPVPTTACDIETIAQEREQLWAEAVSRYQAGEPWYIIERAIVKKARDMQDERRFTDAWGPLIDRYLATVNDVSVGEILDNAIRLPRERWDPPAKNRIGRHLASLRVWRRYKATMAETDLNGKSLREYRYERIRLEDD